MDKNYWYNVLKVRREIFDLMIQFGAHTVMCERSVNPLYSQIIDNGGIGLEFYYGVPKHLYTPLGFIQLFETCSSNVSERRITQKLISDFGAVMVESDKMIAGGVVGPIFSLTRLPWSNEVLPHFEYKERKDYTSWAKAHSAYNDAVAEIVWF